MSRSDSAERYRALLLLGPTGAGKTPLGNLLEQRGLCGHRCVHFDFGENLRQLAGRSQPNGVVSTDDIDFIRNVLETGALFEDQDLPLAGRILNSFLQQREADHRTLIVLNGFPRHAGQAGFLENRLDVREVVLLACSAPVVRERIRRNAGGDRAGRVDDDVAAIERKLEIFHRRTAPLVEHYMAAGAHLLELAITGEMNAEAIWGDCVGKLRERF